MTDINCARFADSRPKALRSIIRQAQDGDIIILSGTSNLDLHLIRTAKLAFQQAKGNACNTFTAWFKDNPNLTRDTILCDLIDDPPLGRDMYAVSCNITFMDKYDVPLRNGLVE